MPDDSTCRKWLQPLLVVGCCFACFLSAHDAVSAQEALPPKPPRIALLNPLSVMSGQRTRVILRGWLLKDPVIVVADNAEIKITVVSHAAATVPGKQKAEQIGDEQLELDIEVPTGFAADAVRIRVRTASGESHPHWMPIHGGTPVVVELEPNDGFRQPQQITSSQLVVGSIHADTNVDVFAVELVQPTKLRIYVEAAALGSNLDSMLTVWTAAGSIVASSDDQTKGELTEAVAGVSENSHLRDSLLLLDLPAGKYLLTLQDAFDRGGPAHPYRLHVQQLPDKSDTSERKP